MRRGVTSQCDGAPHVAPRPAPGTPGQKDRPGCLCVGGQSYTGEAGATCGAAKCNTGEGAVVAVAGKSTVLLLRLLAACAAGL